MNCETKRIRVLFFVPQYPFPVLGGLEKQAHQLAKALHGKGLDVKVISGQISAGSAKNEFVDYVPITRIPWSKSRWVRYLRTAWDITWIFWIRRQEFDVLHLHQNSPVSLYVILLTKLLGKPVLTKLPNVGEYGLPGLIKSGFGRLRLRILLKSDAIVAMSAQSMQELRVHNYPTSRVLRVPNGIDLSLMPVCGGGDEVVRGGCRIVFVGRLNEQKQLELLLEAWGILYQSKSRPVTLHLWGDGPLASDLKAQSIRLGIAETVHFEGHVADVTARLPEMDIFVLPSRKEGNSNAVLEAMAAGLPIVATGVGGTPMQVGEEGAPFLCPPGDAPALAEALKRLIDDPALRHATGAAMRRRVEEFFDIVRIADIYHHAYGCLISGRVKDICHAGHPLLSSDSDA